MPRAAPPRYALIGDGRLASSLGPYLEGSGAQVRQWSRRAEAAGGPSLSATVADADRVLIAISDGAIVSFADTHRVLLKGKQLVHFSGALSLPGLAGAHPLYSFPTAPIPENRMAEIVFVTEDGGPTFGELFPTLSNSSRVIAPAQKPLYHALAVLSGNLVSFAWNEVARVLKDDLDLEPSDLLQPYFRSLIDGFAASPYDSLTGPVARGDQGTIEKNLEALKDRPALSPLYEALVTAHRAKTQQEKEPRDVS